MNTRSNRWHSMPVDDVLSALSTNRYKGLRPGDAAKRRLKDGQNPLWSTDISNRYPSALRQLLDFTTVLFIVSVLLAALFSSTTVTLSVAGLLVFSVCIRTLVVLSTRKILRQCARYLHPRCRVMRGGKCIRLFADQIVEGDILLLSVGDIVPADVRLISGTLAVSEMSLDTSRRRIEKDANVSVAADAVWQDRKNILFASSTVRSGNGVGVAVSVGDRTLMYAKNGCVPLPKERPSAVLSGLTEISHVLSFAMMLLCGLFLVIGLFAKQTPVPLDALFIASIALLVSSVGELIGVIVPGVFAGAMRRMEQSNSCIVKSPGSVEALGQAEWLVIGSEQYLLSGNVFVHSCLDGRIRRLDCQEDRELPGDVRNVCNEIMRSLPKNDSLSDQSALNNSDTPYDTMSSLEGVYGQFSGAKEHVCVESVVCNGLQTSLITTENNLFAYVCGPLDGVLACCSKIADENGIRSLTASDLAQIRGYSLECATHARRTLAVACRLSPVDRLYIPTSVQNSMIFMGCIAVENSVDETLCRLAESCREGNVRIALLCEDPRAAGYLASVSGVFNEEEASCVCSYANIGEIMSSNDFGNLLIHAAPVKKPDIVSEMQRHSAHIVYVGEGLQDLPIISTCASMALESTSEQTVDSVSRRADAILQYSVTDRQNKKSGLGMALQTLAACRGVFIQLWWILFYLLISQALRGVTALLSVCMDVPLLSSTHILLVGCFLDFLIVLVMALRPITDAALSVSRKFIRPPSWKTGLLAAAGIGVLAGLLLSLASLCMMRLLSLHDQSAMEAIRLVGMMAASVTAMHFCTSYSRFRKRANRKQGTVSVVCVIAIMALLALLIIYVCVKRFIPDWRVWPILFVPAIVTGIMLVIHKKTQ